MTARDALLLSALRAATSLREGGLGGRYTSEWQKSLAGSGIPCARKIPLQTQLPHAIIPSIATGSEKGQYSPRPASERGWPVKILAEESWKAPLSRGPNGTGFPVGAAGVPPLPGKQRSSLRWQSAGNPEFRWYHGQYVRPEPDGSGRFCLPRPQMYERSI